jgi:hypothetical protein
VLSRSSARPAVLTTVESRSRITSLRSYGAIAMFAELISMALQGPDSDVALQSSTQLRN